MPNYSVDSQIEEYRSRLPTPKDKQDFDDRLEEEISNTDISEIHDELEDGYRQEEEHLQLVRAVASGFHQTPLADGYESGYQFAFTEPLEEQNSEIVGDTEVKNGDVLLVREDGASLYLCIVECKAGKASDRDWVNELKDIQDVIDTDRYRQTLKSQIGAGNRSIRHVQYVLLGKISTVHGMNYDQIAKDMNIPPNYAFWGYDLGDRSMVHVHGEVRDKSLRNVIKRPIDTGRVENPLEFTFSDHPLKQLEVLIEEILIEKEREGNEHIFEFNRIEFHEKFNDKLQVGFSGDIRQQLVDKRVDHLLEVGKAIGIFVDSPDKMNSNRDYRIYFQGRKPTVAKNALKEKYFDYKSKEKVKERAFEVVKEEFDVRPTQTRLNEDQFLEDETDEDR